MIHRRENKGIMEPIYFNYNSTHPILPEAIQAWKEAAERYWQNPSALDARSVTAYTQLENARSTVAQFCGADTSSIIFTSGATENAHSVFAYWSRNALPSQKVGISVLEHPCVYQAAERYFPGRTVPLKITPDGIVDCHHLEGLFKKENLVGVAVLAASHLLGTLQPIEKIANLCHMNGVSLFVDAAQWAGRLPMNSLQNADWIGISSHKLGGPKGVGALKIPSGIEEALLLVGGHQQNGLRAGTEDVPGICGFAKAWEVKSSEQPQNHRERFLEKILKDSPGIKPIVPQGPSLWNTVGLLVPHASNTRWVKRLEKRGYIVGQGSACGTNPQNVLLSECLQIPTESWQSFLRISSGSTTPLEAWLELALVLCDIESQFSKEQFF